MKHLFRNLAFGLIALLGLSAPVLADQIFSQTAEFQNRVTFDAHIHSSVSAANTLLPVLSSCGSGSPTIVGTDTAGIVTMGTSATGCVITFARAYSGIPFCVVSWIASPLASQSYVTSATAITLTQTSTSGNSVQYICMGR